MRGRAAARKAGHRQIEAATEEMDWADLAEKTRPERGQDAARLDEDMPEAIGEIGVVGGMLIVGLEGDRVLDFDEHGPDPHFETERAHAPHQFGMEVGDRSRLQRKGLAPAVINTDLQTVLDKVEIDLEGACAMGDRRGGEAVAGDVER